MSTSTALHSLNLKPSIFDGKYELNSAVGRGRGSVVYKAYRIPEKGEVYDTSSDPVALKVLTGTQKNPEEALKRIKKEARALVSLSHPNIIRAYNYVARPDCCYLSLEYAEHGDLRKVIEKSKNRISIKTATRITRSILRGLDHIHSHNIVHRDLKLENILVSKDLSIKITDFSISILDGEKNDLNLVNKFVGTLDYVAPECLRGQPYSPRSDLYAVGIIFYKLLTDIFPFEGHSIHDSIELKSRGEFKKLSLEILEEVPRIQPFLEKILSPNPERRFSSAKEAEEELLNINTSIEDLSEQKVDGYIKPSEIVTKPSVEIKSKIKQLFLRTLIIIPSILIIASVLRP